MRNKTSYYICVTRRILELMPEINIKAGTITGYTTDRMKYLISLIISHKQDSHPGAYSVLNMEYLKKVVPYAHKYLNVLREMGIIEWKNYSAGRNSRLYRITKAYQDSIEIRQINDERLIRRIDNNKKQMHLRNSKKYPILNKYVHQVTIDYTQALKTIDITFQCNPDKEKAEARRAFSIAEVEKIRSGQIYIKVNKTNNRYDTNFTRLPGELVKHLTINGKPLTEIDIRNSQPFFASALFNPNEEIQKVIGKTFTMYAKSLNMSDQLDVKVYMLLVKKGKFYDYLMEQFRKNDITFADKKEFKEQLFTVFFGKNSAIKKSKAVQLFESIFPNVYELFAKIKEKDHASLAITLQRIEAFVMLDRIAPEIIRQYPDVEFLTKHDSLLPAGLWVNGRIENIVDLMRSEIGRLTGLKPEVAIKSGEIPAFNSFSHISSIYNTHNPSYSTSLSLCRTN